MKQIANYLHNHPRILLIICLGLVFIAYLINLGLTPIMADEPTRAVVAMEMLFSGNYIVPTINGDLYYNKPPFYTWILALIFHLTGSFSEFTIRMPSVIPLMLFGYTIYRVCKHYLTPQIGLYAGIMYVTCGRMLVYSGMLGHIDIFYSLLTFISFISLLYFYERKQYLLLFVFSYFIMAIGFLCKGLPSIVFQGISLLTFFIYQKEWKRLFSWQHIVGGLFGLAILGAYYTAYFQQNPDIEGYLGNLWNESSKRTVLDKVWYESFIHPFTFPFEQMMHLFPWSLFIVFLFRKGIVKEFLAHPFLKFCFLLLAFNSIPYWLSPQTYPRYLFMLYPFVFIFLAYGYDRYRDQFPKINQALEILFFILGCVLAIGIWAALFVDTVADVPFKEIKTIGIFIATLFSLYLFAKIPTQRFLIFTMIMMLFRVGFDWFVLPHRYKMDRWTPKKNYGLSVLAHSQGSPLYVFPGFQWDHHITYYIERERKEILHTSNEIQPGAYYICAERHIQGKDVAIHDTLYSHYQEKLYLVTFNQTNP